MLVSAPVLAVSTDSTWAIRSWWEDIPASSTAAIGLDLANRGLRAGLTPTTSHIDYVDGGYYMFDPYYPGTRFAISVVL